MTLTPTLLRAVVGCTLERAERFAAPLDQTCSLFDITTGERQAMFLANVGHESDGLAKLRESLDYAAERLVPAFGPHRITAAQADALGRKPGRPADQRGIANQVYGGAWGLKNLGNAEPGDGWRYRAGGLIGITGRANYRELRPALLLAGFEDVPDFESEPEQLERARWAAASAGRFWHSRRLNALADAGDFEAVVRRINGGVNGLADRQQRLARARAALKWAGR